MIIIENLPFKYVEYSDFYGTFLGFREYEDSPTYLCSCMYYAIENFIENYLNVNRDVNLSHNYDNPLKSYILSSNYFPESIVKELSNKEIIQNSAIIQHLRFKDKICHRCNNILPTKKYCHPMYGSQFIQKYGWYFNIKMLELGLNSNFEIIGKNNISDDVLNIADFNFTDLIESINEYYLKDQNDYQHVLEILQYLDSFYQSQNRSLNKSRFLHESAFNLILKLEKENQNKFISNNNCNLDKLSNSYSTDNFEYILTQEYPVTYNYFQSIEKAFNRKVREISKFVENEVRQEFGYRKVGDGWISETILYKIVKELFPSHEIIRHYRPMILEYLELDIYIRDLKLGIEYQGLQHFKPLKHWGGKLSLEKTKLRDKRKRELCSKAGIDLIYFYYNEDLNEELVKQRLQMYIK